MKALLLAITLATLSSQASVSCPKDMTTRKLTAKYSLFLKFNQTITFNKGEIIKRLDKFFIMLRTADPLHKKLIEAGTEFPIYAQDRYSDTVKPSEGTWGPRVNVKPTSDLKYIFMKDENLFSFEEDTANQLFDATDGILEIRCDDDITVIKSRGDNHE